MKKKFVTYCLGVNLFCFDLVVSSHWINPMELVSNNLKRKYK